MFMHVHKCVRLLDTSRQPEQRQWEEVKLQTREDVDKFWHRLKHICLHTAEGPLLSEVSVNSTTLAVFVAAV